MFFSTPKYLIIFSITLIPLLGFSQFINKEIKAEVLIEKNSEFYNFIGTAENLTNTDFNLKYDLLLFTTESDGQITKENKSDRIFIEAHQKLILPSITVNYSVSNKTIIVLIIYDLDDKPLGQDRIVLENGGQTDLSTLKKDTQMAVSNEDQAAPSDGFVMDGFVLENTITKAGKDFYRYFYSEYFNKQIRSSKDILIEEVPGRGINTRISVFVADQLVWQFFAQPRKAFLIRNASIALNRSIAYLQELDQRKNEFIRY